MKFKKLITTLLCSSLVLSNGAASINAYAAQNDSNQYQTSNIPTNYYELESGISPYFSYTQSVTLAFDFNGSDAEFGLFVNGISSVSKISGKISLKKKNSNGSYTTVKSWDISESSNVLRYENSYSVSSRGSYQVSFSGKVYSGSNYDTINISKNGTY